MSNLNNKNLTLKNKTNFNFINGDIQTNLLQNIVYFFLFLIELAQENKQEIEYENFSDSDIIFDYLNRVKTLHSPQRVLNNYFLLGLLKSNFKESEKIKILDLGCGDGSLLELLDECFLDYEYIGVDNVISKNWETKKNKNINFLKFDISEDFEINNFDPDVVISHAVLEHVKYDLSAMSLFFQKFPRSKHLHLLPGVASFFSYRKHGYRRYSKRLLTKISKKLNINYSIIPLGGDLVRQYNKKYESSDHIYRVNEFLKDSLKKSYDLPNFYLIEYN
tara:strand:- start:11 stop:841 length:831 start_codon:yes stop_codon:yes gene_type:complete